MDDALWFPLPMALSLPGPACLSKDWPHKRGRALLPFAQSLLFLDLLGRSLAGDWRGGAERGGAGTVERWVGGDAREMMEEFGGWRGEEEREREREEKKRESE